MKMSQINTNSNSNNNMRRDGGTLIGLDDFDIDYLVLPSTMNDGISETLHERALQKQEEGRVLELKHLPKYQAAKKVLERSKRAVLLARFRLEQSSSSSNRNSDDKDTIKNIKTARINRRQSLPLTAYELKLHLLLIRFDTRLRYVVEHRRKAKAKKAAQEAQMESRRRAALVAQEAAAVGRSMLLKQEQRRFLSATMTGSNANGKCPLSSHSYEDIRSKTTSQLLWMLSDLRDSGDHRLHAMVQGARRPIPRD